MFFCICVCSVIVLIVLNFKVVCEVLFVNEVCLCVCICVYICKCGVLLREWFGVRV